MTKQAHGRLIILALLLLVLCLPAPAVYKVPGNSSYLSPAMAYNSGNHAATTTGNILSTSAGGNWSNPSTWVGGVVPTGTDNVTIADGALVMIDVAASCNSLVVGQGTSGVLQFNTTVARTITVAQDVTVTVGGTFQTGPSGGVTNHILSIGGSLTNNGTIDFSTSSNAAGAGIVFTGAGNAGFTNAGTLNLRQLVGATGGVHMNKGTDSSALLTFTPGGTITVQGANTLGFLSIANGTFEIAGSNPFSNPLFSAVAYTIPATGALWLNDASAIVAGQSGSATNNGTLRVTAGTFNVGTAANNNMSAGLGAAYTIEGGTVNVTGKLQTANPITYNQSGGSVNVAKVGNSASVVPSFGTGTGSSFTMSGGSITIVQINSAAVANNRRDWIVLGTATYTGGTLYIGTGATTGNSGDFTFRINGLVPDLVIDNTTNNRTVTLVGQTSFLGNATINAGTAFNLNGQTMLVTGTTVTNNGTLNGTATGSHLYFLGSGQGPQTYTGTGTLTDGLATLDVDNPSGLTIASTVGSFVTLRVDLFRGVVTNSNKLTIGNAGTTSALVQTGISGATSPGGSFDTAPTFNPGTQGVIIIYSQETVARMTGFELPPNRTAASVAVSNTNGVTLSGGDLAVTGALTLTAGTMSAGANTVIIGPAATVSRAGGYVIGNLRKTFTSTCTKAFEVGTINGYSPVTTTVTAGTFPADFTVRATQGAMPSIFDPTKALQRHWTLAASGITADLTFNYLDPTDIPGTANENNFVIVTYDGSSLTLPGGSVNTAANMATITGVTAFSDWSLAEPVAAYSPTATATTTSTSISTGTPTETPTDTPTDTPTVKPTDTSTQTPTNTPTNTFTQTPTRTPSDTPTDMPTNSPTSTPTNTSTNTPTNTPTDTPTVTATDSPTESPTLTLTYSPTTTLTSTPTNSATQTQTSTPTSSPTYTPSPIPTATSTNSPTLTLTPTSSPTNTLTISPTNTSTISPTNTATNTPTRTSTTTATDSPTDIPTQTPTNTLTSVPTNTATNSPTNTSTQTSTQTPTYTPTNTLTSVPTNSPTNTLAATSTGTSTSTSTRTNTPTSTFTGTPTRTPTESNTSTEAPTLTGTPTRTFTSIPTNSPTDTNTPAMTPTSTQTYTPTRTNTPTNIPTDTSTYTPTNTPTNTPTTIPTDTATYSPTNAPTNSTTYTLTSTATNIPTDTGTPTGTPTNVSTNSPTITITDTATNVPTNTPPGTLTNTPTDTATHTPALTNTPISTETPTITSTVTVPTATFTYDPTSTDTPTASPPATGTPPYVATATATTCVLDFEDASQTDWFYAYVQWMYCQGVVSGYHSRPPCSREGNSCFRPNDNTTRGQTSKIVVLAFAFQMDTSGGPHFSDVPVSSTFYRYIETAKNLGLIDGYLDGTYRTGNKVTRAQIAKIVVNAAINADPAHWALLEPPENTFEDVLPGSTFYSYIETAASHGVLAGYPCGTPPAGPCIAPGNKAYFAPFSHATRAQISKVVYLAANYP